MSVMNAVVLTIAVRSSPFSSSSFSTFWSTIRVCSWMSSGTSLVAGSMIGSCPEVKMNPFAST